MSFHNINMVSIDGEPVDFQEYKGKVCLAVNVASECGLTKQYRGLTELHDANADKGFTVLGFPCNQFAAQEPGTDEEICTFAQERFDVKFPMFSKIEVNGGGTCELYQWLKSSKADPEGNPEIAWNFTKFLIDGDGKVVARFEPGVTPKEIADKLEDVLQ